MPDHVAAPPPLLPRPLLPHPDVVFARETADRLRAEFNEGSPSDVWAQHEVVMNVLLPLVVHIDRLCNLLDPDGDRDA